MTYLIAFMRRQVFIEELENVRTELGEIVDTERNYLHETLERENESLQRQFLSICATNKNEIMNSVKVELQRRLQIAQDKVLLMTDALKQEMEGLKLELGESHVSLHCFFNVSRNMVYQCELDSKPKTSKVSMSVSKHVDIESTYGFLKWQLIIALGYHLLY